MQMTWDDATLFRFGTEVDYHARITANANGTAGRVKLIFVSEADVEFRTFQSQGCLQSQTGKVANTWCQRESTQIVQDATKSKNLTAFMKKETKRIIFMLN